MEYFLKLSNIAKQDIEKIIDYIEYELYAPFVAERFAREIYSRIAKLKRNARIYAVSIYKDVLVYGNNARHITYNGFVIIYTIHDPIVLVHRIIHGSFIKE
jgi:plasmid stabilization system protein ParE